MTEHREYTLREYLAAITFISTHRMFPDDTEKWQVGNIWKAVDQEFGKEPGAKMNAYSLDDKATWTEWEERLR